MVLAKMAYQEHANLDPELPIIGFLSKFERSLNEMILEQVKGNTPNLSDNVDDLLRPLLFTSAKFCEPALKANDMDLFEKTISQANDAAKRKYNSLSMGETVNMHNFENSDDLISTCVAVANQLLSPERLLDFVDLRTSLILASPNKDQQEETEARIDQLLIKDSLCRCLMRNANSKLRFEVEEELARMIGNIHDAN